MITDVTRFIACGCAVDGVLLPGGLVHATDRWRVEHCLGLPGPGTWTVKSKRHVVAVGDLDTTETVGPMTSRERCRA